VVAIIGVDGSLDQTVWAQLNSFDDDAQLVRDGDCAPSVGGGTRQAVVATGWVRCCGTFAKLTSTATGTLAANGGTNDRYDYRVVEFNWDDTTASTLGTPALSAAVQTVQGGGGGAIPSLTQNPGVLWQVPIGLFKVPADGSGLVLTDARPTRTRSFRYVDNAPSTLSILKDAQPRVVSTLSVPDPGWPHIVIPFGGLAVDELSDGVGYAKVTVRLDGNEITAGRAPKGNQGSADIQPKRSEERRVGKECRSRWSPYH